MRYLGTCDLCGRTPVLLDYEHCHVLESMGYPSYRGYVCHPCNCRLRDHEPRGLSADTDPVSYVRRLEMVTMRRVTKPEWFELAVWYLANAPH